MKNKKRTLFLTAAMAVTMSLQMNPIANAEEVVQDWAKPGLNHAVESNVIKGDAEGNLNPGASLTRAELATMVNRILGLTETADLSNFKDVEGDKWYHEEMAKVVKAGIIKGDGENLRPEDTITREEVFTIMSRVYDVESTKATGKVNDTKEVSNWATAAVNGLLEKGFVNGDDAGNLNPKSNITKAEFATMFKNMTPMLITKSGNHNGEVVKGNVLINTENVNIEGMVIEGDLILAEGMNLSDIILKNVKVKGKIITRGGKEIKLEGKSEINEIKVMDVVRDMKISLDKDVVVENIETNTKLELDGKGKVENLVLNKGSEKSEIKAADVKIDTKSKAKPSVDKTNETKAKETAAKKEAAKKAESNKNNSSSGGGSSSNDYYDYDDNNNNNDKPTTPVENILRAPVDGLRSIKSDKIETKDDKSNIVFKISGLMSGTSEAKLSIEELGEIKISDLKTEEDVSLVNASGSELYILKGRSKDKIAKIIDNLIFEKNIIIVNDEISIKNGLSRSDWDEIKNDKTTPYRVTVGYMYESHRYKDLAKIEYYQDGNAIFNHANIKNEADLQQAIDLGFKDIKLHKNFKLNDELLQIKNAKGVIITGTDEEIKGRILIEESENITLENINIDRGLKEISVWQPGNGQAYGIQIYCSDNVKLNNVDIKNSNAGLQVNSSTVEVNGMEISNVGFGGIEVAKGDGVTEIPELKIKGIIYKNQSGPIIWTEKTEGTEDLFSSVDITDEKLTHLICANEKGNLQNWWVKGTEVTITEEVTPKNIRFMVKGITKDGSGGTTVQKISTYDEVVEYFNSNYKVKNGFGLKVEDGKISAYMSNELFDKIKANRTDDEKNKDQNNGRPYRITILNGESKENKIYKLAFYKDGEVELEDLEDKSSTDVVGQKASLYEEFVYQGSFVDKNVEETPITSTEEDQNEVMNELVEQHIEILTKVETIQVIE